MSTENHEIADVDAILKKLHQSNNPGFIFVAGNLQTNENKLNII